MAAFNNQPPSKGGELAWGGVYVSFVTLLMDYPILCVASKVEMPARQMTYQGLLAVLAAGLVDATFSDLRDGSGAAYDLPFPIAHPRFHPLAVNFKEAVFVR